jgi:hypothetical protein
VKIEFIERLLSEKVSRNHPEDPNPGIVSQNILIPQELRNSKFRNDETTRYIKEHWKWPPENKGSYATRRYHIDFKATLFEYVDLCREEGNGFQHPDPQALRDDFKHHYGIWSQRSLTGKVCGTRSAKTGTNSHT